MKINFDINNVKEFNLKRLNLKSWGDNDDYIRRNKKKIMEWSQ